MYFLLDSQFYLPYNAYINQMEIREMEVNHVTLEEFNEIANLLNERACLILTMKEEMKKAKTFDAKLQKNNFYKGYINKINDKLRPLQGSTVTVAA